MNKKGFTLIELIVVIVLLLIISGIIVSSVMTYISTSKEKAFNLLEESIKNSAETIYLDYEASKLLDDNGNAVILISEMKAKAYIELEELKNPINDEYIGDCEITIERKEEVEGKLWKYNITSSEGCPCYNGSCN